MNQIQALSLMLMTAITASACSSETEVRYPARYEAAIQTTQGAAVPADAVSRFTNFFERMHEPDIDARVEDLYAPSAYFSDTLFITERRDQLIRHFERLQNSGARLTINIDDAAVSGFNLYLRWRMSFDFDVIGHERTSATIGMTLLQFDADGRIRFHQDFWDSTEGFYRHVPVLRGALDAVQRQMAAD
jgi:integrase